MAFFAVEKKRIECIYPHNNADKLEIGKVEGLDFQFIIAKGAYNVGDYVVYFPIDSMIPHNIKELFNLSFLHGPDKNRVKTIKLRGKISQGLVLPYNQLVSYGLLTGKEPDSSDLTDLLNVKKYEPEILFNVSGNRPSNLVPLPEHCSIYDIEGVERAKTEFSILLDLPVVVMEKVEGTNISVGVGPSNNTYVNQRKFSILEEPGVSNVYWDTVKRQKLDEVSKELKNQWNCNSITIYGELTGPKIQGNYYKLNEHRIFVFDIKRDDFFIGYEEMKHILKFMGIESVPIINYEKNRTLKDIIGDTPFLSFVKGESLINTSKLREGIVVKPLEERYVDSIGRLILKKRCPEYLAGSDN